MIQLWDGMLEICRPADVVDVTRIEIAYREDGTVELDFTDGIDKDVAFYLMNWMSSISQAKSIADGCRRIQYVTTDNRRDTVEIAFLIPHLVINIQNGILVASGRMLCGGGCDVPQFITEALGDFNDLFNMHGIGMPESR